MPERSMTYCKLLSALTGGVSSVRNFSACCLIVQPDPDKPRWRSACLQLREAVIQARAQREQAPAAECAPGAAPAEGLGRRRPGALI